MEAEAAIGLHELEQISSGPASGGVQPSATAFESNIHLVPVICELSVESLFTVFEQIATASHWPQDVWPVMLMSKLTGKTQEACSALSAKDNLVYAKL